MKLFRCEQIKEIDAGTIRNEPIASIDLMERAASSMLKWYMRSFDRSRRIIIFTGPGNNGGDGLALARLLSENRFHPEVYFVELSVTTSEDWKINRRRLEEETPVRLNSIDTTGKIPFIDSEDIIIDAIFGSGLNRPAEGLAAEVIRHMNESDSMIISVDIPSGLFGEDNSNNDDESIVRADITLTFQFPKLSFLFSENARFAGEWTVLPIGLDQEIIEETPSPYFLLDKGSVAPLIKLRRRFDHKGIYGHALLVAGSYGKAGAALLAAKAALRSGAGLITCHLPQACTNVMQTAVPEAMVKPDNNDLIISEALDTDIYDAIGIGPGMGTDPVTQKAFQNYLLGRNKPFVIDADAINILGLNKKWLSALPRNTVLTPHPREFERISGISSNSYERLEKQMEFAVKSNCVVVLKGAYTSVATPGGKVFFNTTGNPGMATAGSGDALTGIILSLLAQGYSPENASVLGVYLHGMAGDIAATKSCYESVIASDINDNLGDAFARLKSSDDLLK